MYVVAIGASTGGLAAIQDLITELPSDFAAPIVIAVHSGPSSILAEVLKPTDAGKMKWVEDGDRLTPGCIYVVPGGRHALFQQGRLHLSEPVENSGFRPSIDAMFMTLAAEYKSRAIAVVLSGTMEDGMRGAQVIHDMGGQTIVQDPSDAAQESMPNSVIHNDHPEIVRSATDLGKWLLAHVGRSG